MTLAPSGTESAANSTPTGSLRALCVFCGASEGTNPAYMAAAERLGRQLGEQGITLVFGAGNVGIMGQVARATLGAGGSVIGIIPDHLRSVELPSSEGMTLHVVADMHTRKRMMFEQCDAICILPGGLGTLDETFEIITWRQLGLHNKPIILANIEGYWQGFLDLVDQVIDNGFARPGAKELFTVVDQVEAVIPTAQADLPDDTDPRAADKTHLI